MTVSVNPWRLRQYNAVQRPEEPDGIREAAAFVDATKKLTEAVPIKGGAVLRMVMYL